MGNGAVKATDWLNTPFFIDSNPVCIPKSKSTEEKKISGTELVHGLHKLVGSGQKPLLRGTRAVQWADQNKADIRDQIEFAPTACSAKLAYIDAVKLAVAEGNSPFAYWTAHQILADNALDNTQKINFLDTLLSQKVVNMDQLLTTAPKRAAQGIFKALSHYYSPHFSSLVGRYASPKIAAGVLGILIKGLRNDRRVVAVEGVLEQISTAKQFTAVFNECDEGTLKGLLPILARSPQLLDRALKELDPDTLKNIAPLLGKSLQGLGIKTANELIKKYPAGSPQLSAWGILLVHSRDLQSHLAKGLTNDNFKKLMLEVNFHDRETLNALGEILRHSGPKRFNQFFEFFPKSSVGRIALAQAVILDGDLQIRAAKELTLKSGPGKGMVKGHFIDLLGALKHITQSQPSTLGPMVAHMVYSMDDTRFRAIVSHLCSQKKDLETLAYGIEFHSGLQKRIGKQVPLQEFKPIFEAVMALPPTNGDFVYNLFSGAPIQAFTKNPRDPKNMPLEERKNGIALFVMVNQLDTKKWKAFFQSYPYLDKTALVLAKMVVDSSKFQAMVGSKEFSQAEAGRVIDTILNLKIKKRHLAVAIQGITRRMDTQKKNAILFGDSSSPRGSARTQAYLETHLGLNPFRFQRKVLNPGLTPHQILEIRKALIFLAQTAQKNPQVLNPDHLGVVVTESTSRKDAHSETHEEGFEGKVALTIIEMGVKKGKSWSQIAEELKAYGKTIDQNVRQYYDRDKLKFQKTWEGFLRYDELVRTYASWLGKRDPKFHKAYYALLDLSKKDDMKNCEFK